VVRESKFRPELLREAAIALGLLGDKTLVPELVKMLEEAKALSSQASIATALGFIGDSRSVDPLVALLDARRDASARGSRRSRSPRRGPRAIAVELEDLVDLNYRAATKTLIGEGATGVLDIL